MSVDTSPDMGLRGVIKAFNTASGGLGELTEDEVPAAGEPGSGAGVEVCFVVQQDATFPWRTALNVIAGPRFCGPPKAEAKRKAHEWPARIGLAVFRHRCQHQLSGNRRKRVALAVTFVSDPEIPLMDEPFSMLDVQTGDLKSAELRESGEGMGTSVVFVAHGLEESVASADWSVVATVGPRP